MSIAANFLVVPGNSYAANGMGVIECKNVSEDMKTAVTVLNKYESDPNMKYSCKTFKDNNPQAGFDTTVF